MKLLYYMAVAKPIASKCWTPLTGSNGMCILSQSKDQCVMDGVESLPAYIGPFNRFQDPNEWEVKAARVELD